MKNVKETANFISSSIYVLRVFQGKGFFMIKRFIIYYFRMLCGTLLPWFIIKPPQLDLCFVLPLL